MKCLKCGYHSFDYLDVCPKCGTNWKEYKERFNIVDYRPGDYNLLEDLELNKLDEEGPRTLGQEAELWTPSPEPEVPSELEMPFISAEEEISAAEKEGKLEERQAELPLDAEEPSNTLKPKMVEELQEAKETLEEMEKLEPKEVESEIEDQDLLKEEKEEIEPVDLLEEISEDELGFDIPDLELEPEPLEEEDKEKSRESKQE